MYASPYRHDDYAGGLEDIIVHTLLADICMADSRTEISYVDTHAAAGGYGLVPPCRRARIDIAGPSRMLYHAGTLAHPALRALQSHLKRYNRFATSLFRFPGSPELARALLRSRKESLLVERHAATAARLKNTVRDHRATRVVSDDGFAQARVIAGGSLLIFIDPAYDGTSGNDYDNAFRVIRALPKASIAVTYPAATEQDRKQLAIMSDRLLQTGIGHAYGEVFYRRDPRGWRGAGLLAVNTPPGFAAAATRALHELKQLLCLRGARIRSGTRGRHAVTPA